MADDLMARGHELVRTVQTAVDEIRRETDDMHNGIDRATRNRLRHLANSLEVKALALDDELDTPDESSVDWAAVRRFAGMTAAAATAALSFAGAYLGLEATRSAAEQSTAYEIAAETAELQPSRESGFRTVFSDQLDMTLTPGLKDAIRTGGAAGRITAAEAHSMIREEVVGGLVRVTDISISTDDRAFYFHLGEYPSRWVVEFDDVTTSEVPQNVLSDVRHRLAMDDITVDEAVRVLNAAVDQTLAAITIEPLTWAGGDGLARVRFTSTVHDTLTYMKDD